jgi:Holliday junction resolvase RusA-like endonuclease
MPRPRFGNGHAYTPAEAVKAKKGIRAAAELVHMPLFHGPLTLEVAVYLSEDRVTYWKRGSGDWDNYAKLAADALEGIAYSNDAHIIGAAVWKHPADEQGPRLEIVLTGDTSPPVKPSRERALKPLKLSDWKALATSASSKPTKR